MNTRPVLVRRSLIASLAAASLLTTACDPGVGGPSTDRSSDGGFVSSDKARTPGADPERAATEVNRFGAELLGAVTEASPTANVVVSPFSVASALAMTSLGARGATAEEMAHVLGAETVGDTTPADPAAALLDDYSPSMNGLLASLEARTSSAGASGQLDFANAIWTQDGLDWKDEFLDPLAEQYGAGLRTVDFGADPNGTADEINRWVADSTDDRITELVSPDAIDDQTRMMLVNGVALTADWATPFEPDSTYDADFTTGDGQTVSVPMMHMNEGLAAAEGDGWVAVELPYSSGDLSMVVAVPTGDDGAAAETPSIEAVVERLDVQDVVLSLPKFEIDNRVSLNDTLPQLGMPTAFTNAADFSGMTDDEPLKIGDVVHQATITVDEKGTEAAAATAVEMMAGSAAPGDEAPPLEVTADRPFTFWLRDTVTGVVIFTGRVNNPLQ